MASVLTVLNNTLCNISTNTAPSRPYMNVPLGNWPVTIFVTLAIPAVIVFGFIGNILSIVILKDTANSVSTHLYLIALAFMDNVALISIFFSVWAGVVMRSFEWHLYWQDSIWKQMSSSPWSPQLRLYFSFSVRTISIWIVVIFTVERALMVVKPLKFQQFGTPMIAKKAILILVLVTLPISSFCFFSFDTITVAMPCNRGAKLASKANHIFFIGRVAQFVIHSGLPWVIVVTANILIVRTLRNRSELMTQDNRSEMQQTEDAITRRLIAVSIAFLIFTTPAMVMTAIHTYYEERGLQVHKQGVLADVWLFSFFLFTCHFGCNFILYCLTGPVFRQAVRHLLRCHMDEMRETCQSLDPKRRKSFSSTLSTQRTSISANRSESNRSESKELLNQHANRPRRTSSSNRAVTGSVENIVQSIAPPQPLIHHSSSSNLLMHKQTAV